MAVRHLYLARHAEPDADGRLTPRGARQAGLLGRRLAGLPLSSVAHGPLPRATATAALVAAELGGGVPLTELDAAGDYVPHVPSPQEIHPDHRAGVSAFLDGVSAEEQARGAELAAEAIRRWTGPEPERTTATTSS
ncbi:histidine phosphatase family protein [Pimelobacter simplex]|uniref:histidine phosphatase family protein n=1 Tax=Nocardioides simplex TaxID=2045 RepID=UPI001C2036DA|nr:histidine phosphatase family protein [Pimelobacter simplex]